LPIFPPGLKLPFMRRPDLYDVFISAKSADYEHAGKKIRTLLAKNGSSLVYNNVDYGPPP
jgi:hypothetical protein